MLKRDAQLGTIFGGNPCVVPVSHHEPLHPADLHNSQPVLRAHLMLHSVKVILHRLFRETKAGVLAKKELHAISKQVDGLKRQLLQTSKRLRKALS